METIKSYTDLEQSKKLAKILPLESADMKILPFTEREYRIVPINDISVCGREDEICAWSLAALFSVLPNFIGDYGKCLYYDVGGHYCGYMVDGDFMLAIEETNANNPVDACVEMIIKLHELNLI